MPTDFVHSPIGEKKRGPLNCEKGGCLSIFRGREGVVGGKKRETSSVIKKEGKKKPITYAKIREKDWGPS